MCQGWSKIVALYSYEVINTREREREWYVYNCKHILLDNISCECM